MKIDQSSIKVKLRFTKQKRLSHKFKLLDCHSHENGNLKHLKQNGFPLSRE
jgi:hypothetical protein